MFTQTRKVAALALVATFCTLCAAPLQAAQHCVQTTSQLLAALTSAGQSAEGDDVRLRSGTYTLSADVSVEIDGALTLRGGWGPGCLLQSNNPEATTIGSATPRAYSVTLRPQDDDLSVERITFDRLSNVGVFDEGVGDSVVGSIALRRNRFVGNEIGPILRARDKHLRVENNIIVDSVRTSLTILRAQATAPVDIDVHFNTVVGGSKGAVFTGTPGVARFRNNVMFGGASNGALEITFGLVAVNHNLVGAIVIESGGGAAPAGSNLTGVDPLLDAALIPLAGSPVLHTGTNNVGGGLPATDYAGTARKVGSRVDRGARESTLSDIDTLVVTSTADAGAGTLRQAILDANVTLNEETIAFDIDGSCPRSITLATPLPTISNTLTIDGYTQPGSSPNAETERDDSVHCVALIGDGARALNLTPAAEQEITVRGLAFYRSGVAAIQVSGAGRAAIMGNTFNTGTSLFTTEVPDYAISVDGAEGTRIGGNDIASRNIIGRASIAGIRLGPGTGRVVERNFIGISKGGSGAVGNGIGVLVIDGQFDGVDGNFIGNSVTDGLRVQGSQSIMNIQRNVFGIAPSAGSGNSPTAPNGRNGMRLEGGSSFFVRVNRIAQNLGDGIAVLTGAKGADLGVNFIENNGLLGIDLSPDGVNPIDTDTAASGANASQNFPELISAGGGDAAGTVAGQLRSANGSYEVTLYAGSCDSSGHGEGGPFIGGAVVVISNGTDVADGTATFTASVRDTGVSGGLDGRAITAIATEASGADRGSSSEFSACIEYVSIELFRDGFEE